MKISEINKLGKELELYTTIEYIGKGFPIILPRGAKVIKTIRNEIEKMEEENGYKNVRTPSLSNSEIYKMEDRYSVEKENLFIIKDNEQSLNDINTDYTENEIVLKPYSQPFHCSIYKLKNHSYKELPIKYCETSTVFRNERDIKGIMRTRQITLSDANIFCDITKIKKELKEILKMQNEFVNKLGLDLTYKISTWDENKKEEYIGQISEWQDNVQAMKDSLDELNISYDIDNKAKMFGPSISLYYEDIEFSVLQIDFEITHRFELKYTSKENTELYPIFIHNTIVGSYENLLNILIDKYEGNFPTWIAPQQAVIITDGEEFDDYALKVKNKLEKYLRIEIDNSQNSKQNKVENNTNLKIPYIITIGKDELNGETITVNNDKKYKIEEFEKEVINWQTK